MGLVHQFVAAEQQAAHIAVAAPEAAGTAAVVVAVSLAVVVPS